MTNTSIQTPENDASPYWGFFATIALAILAFIIYGLVQAAIIIGMAFSNGSLSLELLTSNAPDLEKKLNDIIFNGDLLGMTGIPSTLVGVGLIILFVFLKDKLSISQYLDLRSPQNPIKTYLKWIGVMLLVFVAMEVGTYLIGHEAPEFMSRIYSTSNNKILLWITVGVAAPIFEEFLFRGFLLEGLRHSFVGTAGAIILTSATFAIIHQQYGWFEIVPIFIIGVIFAVAKLKTNSLYVPIVMHMFMNLSASALMEFAPELAQ